MGFGMIEVLFLTNATYFCCPDKPYQAKHCKTSFMDLCGEYKYGRVPISSESFRLGFSLTDTHTIPFRQGKLLCNGAALKENARKALEVKSSEVGEQRKGETRSTSDGSWQVLADLRMRLIDQM